MSRKNIHRDVKPGSIRAVGDAPAIGRVARMKGAGMPKGERRTRSKGQRYDRLATVRKRTMLVWSGMIALASVLVLGYFLKSWLSSQRGRKSIADDAPLTYHAQIRSEFPSPSESESLNLVKGAIENRNPELVFNYFRQSDVSPAEIIAFLESLAETDGTILRYDWLSSMDANQMSLEGVLVTFKNGDKEKARIAILTHDDKGVWRMDFASFALLASPPIEELSEQRVDRGIVRVYITRDNYYNGPFQDEKKWICHGLLLPESEELVLGYCKIGSRQATAIAAMFSSGARTPRAMLEISRVTGGEARQFEILNVVAEDWVMGEAPFESYFR